MDLRTRDEEEVVTLPGQIPDEAKRPLAAGSRLVWVVSREGSGQGNRLHRPGISVFGSEEALVSTLTAEEKQPRELVRKAIRNGVLQISGTAWIRIVVKRLDPEKTERDHGTNWSTRSEIEPLTR